MRDDGLWWHEVHAAGTWRKMTDGQRSATLGMLHFSIEGFLWARVATIAEWVGCSRPPIFEAFSILEAAGHMQCLQRTDGRGSSRWLFIPSPAFLERKGRSGSAALPVSNRLQQQSAHADRSRPIPIIRASCINSSRTDAAAGVADTAAERLIAAGVFPEAAAALSQQHSPAVIDAVIADVAGRRHRGQSISNCGALIATILKRDGMKLAGCAQRRAMNQTAQAEDLAERIEHTRALAVTKWRDYSKDDKMRLLKKIANLARSPADRQALERWRIGDDPHPVIVRYLLDPRSFG